MTNLQPILSVVALLLLSGCGGGGGGGGGGGAKGSLGDRLKDAGWAVFVSVGCGHCQKLMKENPDLKGVMVDANSEQGQQLSQKFSLGGAPAFVNLKTGKKQMGYIPRAQIELLV